MDLIADAKFAFTVWNVSSLEQDGWKSLDLLWIVPCTNIGSHWYIMSNLVEASDDMGY